MKKGLTRMSFTAKMLVTVMLILLIGTVGILKFTQPSTISANEEQTTQSVTNTDSQTDVVQALNNQVLDPTAIQARASVADESSTAKLIPATEEEIAARNEAANNRMGFDPNVNVKMVGTWAEFKAAYDDQSVTKIVLKNNIVLTAYSYVLPRTASIEIDGQKNTLDLSLDTLRIGAVLSDGIGFFHIHDIHMANGQVANGSGGTNWAFIGGLNGSAYSRVWTYRVGNITTETTTGKRVARIIRGSRAEITVYGKNSMITTAENFYAGSVVIEDGTEWYGEDTGSDYAVVWFELDSTGTDTGVNEDFLIGKNCQVILKNTTAGTLYPAVYSFYNTLTVGENSIYNANMQGNSVRYNQLGSGMVVKSGAVANLLSRGSGVVMQFTANDSWFEVEPGGSVYIVGSTTSPVVDMTGGANKRFTLNSPKGFDIRNKNTGGTNNSPAVSTGIVQTNVFTINDSDIDLWKLRTDINGPSTETYAKVGNFSVKAGGNTANVTTSEPGLSAMVPTQYRRIAGMNSNPEIEWIPVTDADYSYKARVMIGYTASDEFDENSNVILQPVYASENQAYVTYVDTFGEEHVAYTDTNGYATVTDTRFNTAGQTISGVATRGPWISEEPALTTVIDVTPPEPAKVTGDKVTNAAKQLIGTGAEANAKIFVQINGGELTAAGTVATDGSWTYNLPAYLSTGDKVKIFLEDNAGAAPADLDPIPPATNSVNGNINPATTALSYRDALFQPATEYTVVDVLPDNPAITKTVSAYRKGTEVSTTQVGDTLLYTITAKNDKASTFDTVWSDVVITDTLPAGLDFDSATAEVTIDGTVIDENQYSYNPDTRLFSVNIGNLATQESAVVSFKTTVARSAVGQVITNTAKAEGDSPREVEPFEPGPEIEGKAHEKYDKTSLGANNPGGAVYGTLELLSAPAAIDFGSVSYAGKNIRVDNPTKIGDDLVVQDSRATRESWTLKATLITPMTQVGGSGYVLDGALKYVYQGTEITLNGGAQDVMVHTNSSDEYNVSSTWSESGDGMKLEVGANQLKEVGDYQGEILWQLGDTP